MMSRRAAAIRRESERVERCGIRKSLESGAVRAEEGWNGVVDERVAVGMKKVFRTVGIDFVR